jgi:hypothetical protein
VTVELYGQAPPNEVVFVLAHLLPLAGEVDKLGAHRWAAGMPLPYRSVTVIPGGSDLITRSSLVRVHTFGATYTEAARAADDTDRRMLVLAEDPLFNVPMPDGTVANCQSLDGRSGPREEPYGAESVVIRFISEYDLALRFGPVPA